MASWIRYADHQRVGHAEHDRERPRARTSAGRKVRTQTARLGSQKTQACAGARSGRRTANAARIAAGARPEQSLRFRWCGHQPEGSVVIHLDVASDEWAVGGEE